MSRGYTSEEIFDASKDGEPVMVTRKQVADLFAEHDCDDVTDFWEKFFPAHMDTIDAAEPLAWLGY